MKKITITVDDVVALRKESVDRNCELPSKAGEFLMVALRKESVDRNRLRPSSVISPIGRSPQGERG